METTVLSETIFQLKPKSDDDEECVLGIDESFNYIYNLPIENVILIFDCTERMFNLNTLLKIRPVIEKYRPLIRIKQFCTYMLIKDPIKRTIMTIALKFIKTEKPVYILKSLEEIEGFAE